MSIPIGKIIVWLIIGALAGTLAGRLMTFSKRGFGLWANVGIGMGARGQIHTYTELRQQIHDDLRVQHPEWVQPDGKSPMCDSYEARLMELLDPLIRKRANQFVG
jgi:type II secretory pathway pseudopilin PulG